MVIVWLIIGFVVFMVFTGNWARLCEALWPFKYTGVQLSELEDHFNEFARRGYSGAWMVVVAEGTTESQAYLVQLKVAPRCFALRLVISPRSAIPEYEYGKTSFIEYTFD